MYKAKFNELLLSKDESKFYMVMNYSKAHKTGAFNQIMKMGHEFHLINTVNHTVEVIEADYIEDSTFFIMETVNSEKWTCVCGHKNLYGEENCLHCGRHYESVQ